MQRLPSEPRANWQAVVEALGLHFHTSDGEPYWDESAYYSFAAREIDRIEQATYALNDMCLKAVEHVIAHDLFAQFRIPAPFVDYVKKSWEKDEDTVYNRFDFSYDGTEPPKLLEYNADTPTALLEASVIQWYWMKDVHPNADQFNSIHERLLEIWSILRGKLTGKVHFASLRGHLEDYMTVQYLRDTAFQSGLETAYLEVERIGWHEQRRLFTDEQEQPLRTVFKLYPWEWMIREQFGPHLLNSPVRWLEPPWKMLLSNKAILPVLYHLFPDSPYLLRTEFEPFGATYIRKPVLGREGSNIAIVFDGKTILETDGPYEEGPWIYQEVKPLPRYDGNYPVIGSWIVNGYACGMGIREDDSPITRNTSRFVPHIMVP